MMEAGKPGVVEGVLVADEEEEGSLLRASAPSESVAVAAERLRQLELVNSNIFGTVTAVAWSYIIVLQVDPELTCPRKGCWAVVGALFVSMVFLSFALPSCSLAVIRRLAPYAKTASGDHAPGFWGEVARMTQRFATEACGSCWAVTGVTMTYYALKQLEYGTGEQVSSWYATTKLSLNSFSKDVLADGAYLRLLATCGLLCLGMFVLTMWLMLFGLRRLAVEKRAYWVEFYLLLSSAPHYLAAYAMAELLAVVFFSPLAFNDAATFSLSCAEAVFFVVASRGVSRAFGPHIPQQRQGQALQEAATSPKIAALLLVYTGCPVVAGIGIQSALSYLLVTMLALSPWRLFCFYAVYAPLLLTHALFRGRQRLTYLLGHPVPEIHRLRSPRPLFVVANLALWDRDHDHPFWDLFKRKARDAPFEDGVEKWLCAFAFWNPFKLMLVYAWSTSGFTVDVRVASTSELTVTALTMLARLVWEITLGVVLTGLFGALAALPVLAGTILQRRVGRTFDAQQQQQQQQQREKQQQARPDETTALADARQPRT